METGAVEQLLQVLGGAAGVLGIQAAIEDINAAGGINGEDVILMQGDSGDLTTDIANTEVDRLLAAGSSVIIGAASSSVTKTVIDKITGSGNVMFSPANTAADLTTYADNNLYFRTAPSDILQGKVIADLVVREGHTNAAILYRQDSWGQGLFDLPVNDRDEFIPLPDVPSTPEPAPAVKPEPTHPV